MPEVDPNNPEGLSKGQQKKLAKKAEKAAKKAGVDAATPAAAAAKGGGAPKAAAAAPPPPPPVWKIGNPDAKCQSTLKVALASQLYGVTLEVASKSALKKAAANDFFSANNNNSTSHSAVLLYGNNMVGGGGNAMAKALRHTDNSVIAPCVPAVDVMVDEWCEWERTTLRSVQKEGQWVSALKHLDDALQTGEVAVHLVGTSDSLADVVVCTTLATMMSSTKGEHAFVASTPVPPLVATYMKSHAHALEAAQALATKWQAAAAASSSKVVPLDLDHPSLLHVLTAVFQQAALSPKLLNGDEDLLPNSMVTKCQNAKHGDYQCMAAMPIFSALKKANALPDGIQSPGQVADAIIEAVGSNHPVIENLTKQGPGFVLCTVKSSYLQSHLNKWLPTGKLPKPPSTQGTYECVVDFSSPNIAKEMHVGHLRSTIIGEAVCRILEFMGHHVHRTNHVGDWGTQFGMLIQYLKEEYPEVGTTGEIPNITDLTVFYKNAKERFDDDADFKKTAQTNVVKLQSGDEECLKIWKMLCDVSRREFQKVYNRLDVNLTEKGESFYNEKIPPVIVEFDQAGLVSVEEGGAKCVFVDGHQVPLMLQKSDGGFGYDSTDMAALKYRLQTLHAKRIIVITDYSQGDHFKMCYAAARKIGWLDAEQRLDHIGFGTVQGEDGKRFKTRSGDTVRLVDLLDEAVQRMEDSLNQRIEDGKANITKDEVHGVAEAIGYGACKYFDLRRNPTTNYKFSYDDMLDTKGNTAVYLLYARVRLESIIAKAKAEHGVDVEELIKAGETPTVEHASERKLVLQLHLFADTMELTLEDLFPYHICEYVYNVSIAASDFVTNCKVLGSPEMNSRLLLCRSTIIAMTQCFDLLGIRHVTRI